MKIIVADDHELFRAGISQYLCDQFSCLILEAKNYEEVYYLCDQHEDISLILIDLDMPDANGLKGVLDLRREYSDIKIAVVSGIDSVQVMFKILDSGLQGFIPKSLTSGILKRAIDLIIEGGVYIPLNVLSAMQHIYVDGFGKNEAPECDEGYALTRREKDVLKMMIQGASNKEIARHLDISVATVRTHTVSIFRTLNVSNRTQASQVAVKYGLA